MSGGERSKLLRAWHHHCRLDRHPAHAAGADPCSDVLLAGVCGRCRLAARTTPVLLALFSVVTVLALKLSQDEPIPVPVTAWYHKAEPTFADCLAWVRWHLWRARYLVNSASQAECMQFCGLS
jgi:hypothetical protein